MRKILTVAAAAALGFAAAACEPIEETPADTVEVEVEAEATDAPESEKGNKGGNGKAVGKNK